MSSYFLGKTLPKIVLAEFERNIAGEVAQSLRKDFPNLKAAARVIATQAEINMNTIKKWYNGTNVPSAINLIILARVSPSVKVMLLLLIDTNELE